MTRSVAVLVLVFGVGVCSVFAIRGGYQAEWVYHRDVNSFLSLADAASTAPAKLEYLEAYRHAFDKLRPDAYGAMIWKTPAERVDSCLRVVDSCIERLRTIVGMDEKSLEYQQAMFQVTQHEFDALKNATGNNLHRAWILETQGTGVYLWGFWVLAAFLWGLAWGCVAYCVE